jgi:hypothetical protein
VLFNLFVAMHYVKNAHCESGSIVVLTHELPYQPILELCRMQANEVPCSATKGRTEEAFAVTSGEC